MTDNFRDDAEIIKRLGMDPVVDDNTVWLLMVPNTPTPIYSYDWDEYAESKVWEELFNKGNRLMRIRRDLRTYQIFPKFMKENIMGHCIDRLEEKILDQQRQMREMCDGVDKFLKNH